MDNDKIKKELRFLGKPLEECSREELLNCATTLYRGNVIYTNDKAAFLEKENDRLKEENKKLWKAVGGID